jgi:hypothetical protein
VLLGFSHGVFSNQFYQMPWRVSLSSERPAFSQNRPRSWREQIQREGKWTVEELMTLVPNQLMAGIQNPAPPPADLERFRGGRRRKQLPDPNPVSAASLFGKIASRLTDQPPYLKPPDVSSSGPPSADYRASSYASQRFTSDGAAKPRVGRRRIVKPSACCIHSGICHSASRLLLGIVGK